MVSGERRLVHSPAHEEGAPAVAVTLNLRHAASVSLLAMFLFLFAAVVPLQAFAGTEIETIEVESYRRDHGVSTQVAERDLATQRRGTGIVERLEAAQGNRYAGVWFDNETGDFVVPTLGERSRASARGLLETAGLTGSYRTVSAEYSWAELKAAHSRLAAELLQMIRQNKVRTFLDPRTNAVVIEQAAGASGGEATAISKLAGEQDVRVDVRPRKAARFSASPVWCLELHSCGKPLRGGVKITNEAVSCTAGFKATGSGEPYILTAGHCADEEPDWYAYDTENGYALEKVGQTAAYKFPGGDWAKIAAGGSYWDQNPWPSLVAYWGVDEERDIEYEDSSYVGQQVCHSGIATGSSCGTVTAVDYTFNNKQFGPIYHMTKFGPTCVASGDSGGPVFNGNTALGLVSHADAGEGGPCGANIYYTEITEATDELGVTVAPSPPELLAATGGADNIEAENDDGMAVLHGTINPGGLEASYKFEWGKTKEYASSTALEVLGSTGTTNYPVSAAIKGLEGKTEFHYRLRAENGKEVVFGEDKTFETPDWRPQVTIGSPEFSPGKATLNATINPTHFDTKYHIEWGNQKEYEEEKLTHTIPIPDEEIGGGGEGVEIDQTVDVDGETTYHYRVIAESAEGTGEDEDEFTTPNWKPVPAASTATEITGLVATLNGTVNPTGFGTTYYFEYDTSPYSEEEAPHGTKVPAEAESAGSGAEAVPVSTEIENLEEGTTYYFRLIASSSQGTVEDIAPSFRTFAIPTATTTTAAVNGPSAILRGTANANGGLSYYQFEYADNMHFEETEEYDQAMPANPYQFSASEAPVDVAQYVAQLKEGEIYHYRLKANNPAGTSYGEDQTFVTEEAPFSKSFSFGSYGEGEGEFDTPWDIEVGANGDIYVSEGTARIQRFDGNGNYLSEISFPEPVAWFALDFSGDFLIPGEDSVQRYDSEGELVSEFGSAGSGNGEFNTVVDVAVDAEGNIYVCDLLNYRVQKFTPSGEYLMQFGSEGSGQGEFDWLSHIDVAANGEIVVMDSGRIQWFDAEGNFLHIDERPQGWTSGYFGIAADPEGRVFATDSTNYRVVVYDHTGVPAGQFGYFGGEGGDFRLPLGVAVRGGNEILVADYFEHVVSVWNAPPSAPSATTQDATGVTATAATLAGTVDPESSDTTYRFEYGTTTEYGSSVPVPAAEAGFGSFPLSVEQSISGLQADTTYHYRLVAENELGTSNGDDRQFATLEEEEDQGEGPSYSSSIGSYGSGNGQLSSPAGVAANAAGDLWVVDRGNNRLQKFDSEGEYVGQFGSYGSGNGQFDSPRSVAIDSEGNLWVVDSANHRIQKFDSEGEYLTKCGSEGSGEGQFSTWGPKDIAVDPEDNVWVTDYSGRAQKFSSSCEYLGSVGSYGSGEGQFYESAGIDVAAGKLWISDWVNDRVSVFSEAGEFLFQFGSSGWGEGQLNGPDGVDVDGQGNVWVLDVQNNRVEWFDFEGEYVGQFGSSGSGEGQFSLSWPASLDADDEGHIWIADNGNHRVQGWD